MTSFPGSQDPTFAVCPSSETQDDDWRCFELARRFGVNLLPWQRSVLSGMLGRDGSGLWSAPTAGVSLARQNGKTDGVIVPRAVYGMAVLGEQVLYTAQLQKTANETFRSVRDAVESGPLKDAVRAVHLGRGFEEVEMANGGRMKFLARTRNGGRGQHADLIIYDEAQELTDAELESFSPAISASHNPQALYLGTPPTPDSPGGVFRRIRREAHDGSNLTYWAEWGVGKIPDDVSDESLWAMTNPSLGVLILPRTIAKEATELSADGFARERLGWWSPETVMDAPAIDPAEWDACEVEDPGKSSPDERVACGVKFSPDGTTYSVSFAARGPDRPVLVECYDRAYTNHGIGGLAEALVKRKDSLTLVALDGREWTPTLSQRLLDLGFPKRGIHVMKVGEVADACAMLSGAVADRTLAHVAQPLLRQSIATSPRRQIGRDGWGFGGDDPTPAESVALAHWAVVTSRRNPKRKLRVGI